jgi:hypothetical protein
VTITNDAEAVGVAEGTAVRVGNTTGRLGAFGASASVGWDCGDRGYFVGGNVDNTTLLQVARSVGCG